MKSHGTFKTHWGFDIHADSHVNNAIEAMDECGADDFHLDCVYTALLALRKDCEKIHTEWNCIEKRLDILGSEEEEVWAEMEVFGTRKKFNELKKFLSHKKKLDELSEKKDNLVEVGGKELLFFERHEDNDTEALWEYLLRLRNQNSFLKDLFRKALCDEGYSHYTNTVEFDRVKGIKEQKKNEEEMAKDCNVRAREMGKENEENTGAVGADLTDFDIEWDSDA